jgi:hypothetical protein
MSDENTVDNEPQGDKIKNMWERFQKDTGNTSITLDAFRKKWLSENSSFFSPATSVESQSVTDSRFRSPSAGYQLGSPPPLGSYFGSPSLPVTNFGFGSSTQPPVTDSGFRSPTSSFGAIQPKLLSDDSSPISAADCVKLMMERYYQSINQAIRNAVANRHGKVVVTLSQELIDNDRLMKTLHNYYLDKGFVVNRTNSKITLAWVT